jgi:hypothetical protein
MNAIKIGERWIGGDHPTYFIADISANHDGDLERSTMPARLTTGVAGVLEPPVPTRKAGYEAFGRPSVSRDVRAAGLTAQTGSTRTPDVSIRSASQYV